MFIHNTKLFTRPYLTSNMEEADQLIIVDLANFAFRQALARKTLIVQKGDLAGRSSGHIFGTVQSLSAKLRDWGINKNLVSCFVFCLEGYPKVKYKAFPGYKAGRTTRAKLGFNPDQEVVPLVGMIPGVYAGNSDCECDDIIATVVEHWHDKVDCIVMTTDEDMWALSEQASIVTFKDKIVSQTDMWNKYGTVKGDAYKVPIVKAIYGDASDRIPKIKLPRNAWPHLEQPLNDCDGTIESFYEHVLKIKKLDIRDALIVNKKQVFTMFEIACLNRDIIVEFVKNEGDQNMLIRTLKAYDCFEKLDKSQSRFYGSY